MPKIAALLLAAAAAAQEPAESGRAADQVDSVVPRRLPIIERAVADVQASRLRADVDRLAACGTRHTLSSEAVPGRGIAAARRWLLEEGRSLAALSGGRLQVSEDPHEVPPSTRVPAGATVINVVYRLPGSEPDRILVVSGHLDSRGSDALDAAGDAPGANDDASGVAVALETARVLAPLALRATVVFLFTSGEEQGLLGARGYAEAAAARRDRILAMATHDIVGGTEGQGGQSDPFRVRLFSEGVISGPRDQHGRPLRSVTGSDNDAPSRQLARYLKLRGELYVPGFSVTLVLRQDRYGRGGDHRAFNDQGYAAVRFTEPFENWDRQHQDPRMEGDRRFGDLPEFVDAEYLARVTRVNVAGFLELALAPAPPANVRLITSQLGPDAELRWRPSPSAEVEGYGILLRRTDEPTWTERRALPAEATQAVIEGRSMDDWIFAVDAVGPDGAHSLPVHPEPARR